MEPWKLKLRQAENSMVDIMDVPNLQSAPWVPTSEQREHGHTPVQHKQRLVGIWLLSFVSFLLFITCRRVGFVLFFFFKAGEAKETKVHA